MPAQSVEMPCKLEGGRRQRGWTTEQPPPPQEGGQAYLHADYPSVIAEPPGQGKLGSVVSNLPAPTMQRREQRQNPQPRRC